MKPVFGIISAFMSEILIFALKIYKYAISPMLPPACRYYPTCSEYAVTAFKKHGLLKGLYLSIRRIARCNPFFPGGYDPVPDK